MTAWVGCRWVAEKAGTLASTREGLVVGRFGPGLVVFQVTWYVETIVVNWLSVDGHGVGWLSVAKASGRASGAGWIGCRLVAAKADCQSAKAGTRGLALTGIVCSKMGGEGWLGNKKRERDKQKQSKIANVNGFYDKK